MLIATWILAVSTAILAVGGPIAFLSWWKDRAEDRERRRREREQEARDRVLRDAEDKFITKADAGEKYVAKDDAGKKYVSKESVAVTVVVAVLGALLWFGRDKPSATP
jgi:hypothetical protein